MKNILFITYVIFKYICNRHHIMIENNLQREVIEVFVFCLYPNKRAPQAVFIDISKIDKNSDIEEEIKEMTKYGTIYESIWKMDGNSGILTGHMVNNIKIDNDNNQHLSKILFSWSDYAEDPYMRGEVYDNMLIFDYYINDMNSCLSPKKLHEKLLRMTEPPENWYEQHKENESCELKQNKIKFIVKQCVLVSDISINKKDDDYMNSLRFFVLSPKNSKQN